MVFCRVDQGEGSDDFERCDDGNEVEEDACLSNCIEARCGDGVLRQDRQRGQSV